MGWWRQDETKGLYRGDAPVSLPSSGRSGPRPYDGPQPVDHAAHAPGGAPTRFSPDSAVPGQLPARKSPNRAALPVVFVVALLLVVGWMSYRSTASSESDSAASTAVTATSPRTPGPDADNDPDNGLTPSHPGVRVPVQIGSYSFDMTLIDAYAQPGRAWQGTLGADRPTLMVRMHMARTDDGSDRVRMANWVWSLRTETGDRILSSTAFQYQPDLAAAELASGDDMVGFVTFTTDETGGTLIVSDSSFGPAQAIWPLETKTPRELQGSIGRPIQAEISRPPFTVDVSDPRVVPADDPSVDIPPETGRYYVVDVDIVPVPSTSEWSGLLNRSMLVLVTPSGDEVQSSTLALKGSLSTITLHPDAPAHTKLAFDTKETTGELEFRDAVGRTLISWPLTFE